MIVQVIHISTADKSEFADKIKFAVAKMQNECGLKVEVEYQTATAEDGYNTYVVYSALVIGRESEDTNV